MKIALLGGSFDPPHLGHYLIAQQVREQLAMDEVWLIPLYQKDLQDKAFHKQLSSVEDRVTMAKFLKNSFIKVSQFEIEQNQTSYTLKTLQGLTTKYPEHTFYWILGSDQLESFQKYYHWQELVQKHNLIIFPREHMLWHLEERVKEAFQLQTIPENVIVLHKDDLVLTNIASSVIRKRIKKGLPIKYLVPKEIEEYLRKKGLYSKRKT
ncbi:MAG: nicotinate (nicotinamide) nucleotide adenylyltransferase [Patescibacteria group bacterium]